MIYLDHNATTPTAPEVLEAMMPYLTAEWGNPSSSYRFGANLRTALERAREQVAALLGAYTAEILFTSSATESNNTAINAALKARVGKRHAITSAVEHSSVLSYFKALEAEGCRVTYLPVDRDGLLKLADLEASIDDDTALVSVMWANNETGVLFPVKQIAEVCRARGVLFHCDAVQAAGKLAVDVTNVPVDYLSITAHKFNGPKGIGALYVNRGTPFSSYLHGGHQERGRRGGTENVALIVGMGVAAQIALRKPSECEQYVRQFRDAIEDAILQSVGGAELNGHKIMRLGNTSNISFDGIESEALLLLLDEEGICASSGSACLADSTEPSHVIKAMKPETAETRQSIRLSLGTDFRQEDVTRVVIAVREGVSALRDR
jgi:cysteine desulfurase